MRNILIMIFSPVNINNTTSSIFDDPSILSRVPLLMLATAAIYATIYLVGVILVVEKHSQGGEEEQSLSLKESCSYLWGQRAKKDFYLLFR